MKCDEAKPACQKCISTGRICDGYPNPKALQIRLYDPETALRDPASLRRDERPDIVSLSDRLLDILILTKADACDPTAPFFQLCRQPSGEKVSGLLPISDC